MAEFHRVRKEQAGKLRFSHPRPQDLRRVAKHVGRHLAGLLETANLPRAFPAPQRQEIGADVCHGMEVVKAKVAQMGSTEHIDRQADPPGPDQVPGPGPQVAPAGDRDNLERCFRPGPVGIAEHEQAGIPSAPTQRIPSCTVPER